MPHTSQTQTPSHASLLSDLYCFICIVEAGSFSAAAERIGIAKSSLSRRISQLEKRLNVQLLARTPRSLNMTPVGERIYRHALDMLAAAEAAQATAQNANDAPSGPLHLSVPAVLIDWLLGCLDSYRTKNPDVEFFLTTADDETDLSSNRLDISLTLDSPTQNSSEIVARALASIEMVIVGSAELVRRLGNPKYLDEIKDQDLLALGHAHKLQPWVMQGRQRPLQRAALCAHDWQLLTESARAGFGLACVPLYGCRKEIEAGTLLKTCLNESPKSLTLYALTNSHRSITPAIRTVIEHIRGSLARAPIGLKPITNDA